MIEFYGVTDESVEWVALHMRESDTREVFSATGLPNLDVLQYSVQQPGETLVAWDDEEPIALFGVSAPSLLSTTGSPWMLGTDRLKKYRRELMKFGKLYVKEWSQRYDTLMNFVHAENVTSVRWLRRIGFSIHDPIPWGVRGELFHPFIMLGEHHV